MPDTDTPGEQTFEQQVNAAAAQLTPNAEGVLEFPAELELDPAVKYAATLEKRRRDTQAQFTKSQQQLKEAQATAEDVAKHWEAEALAAITSVEQEKLDELKFTDPDAWRTQMDSLSTQAKNKFAEKRKLVTDGASKRTELSRRTELLEAYNTANPNHTISDDVIANDVPPRYLQQLEKGEVTFDEFLDKCGTFLKGTKVVAGTPAPGDIDLSSQGGGATPSAKAVEAEAQGSYAKEIF